MKKIAAIVLCLCLVLGLCGCGGTENAPNEQTTPQSVYVGDGISLACNTADSFNPYKSKTELNRLIGSLLYDSLFLIDNAYNPINVLADKFTIENGVCTVTLKSALFSDGGAVTSADVVYSFNLAKASPRYSSKLESVLTASAQDNKTVVFTANKNDAYMVNLLTFPIIKKDSDSLKNQDDVELPPIGCGRYKLNDDLEGLTVNEKHYMTVPTVKKVKLINTPDEEALSHAIEIGAVDMYYTDLSDCNILRMSGNRVNVTLNNLVYIGVNLNKSILKNPYMRHGLSLALNREKICEDGYYTNAVAATGVYNPAWQVVKGVQSIQTTGKFDFSIENFNKMGYNIKNNEGFFVNAGGDVIELCLLVNKENNFRNNAAELIKSQLATVGIKIKIESVPYNQYIARLNAGQFDLYLAEVEINDNMDLTELLCPGGKAAYGIEKISENKKNEENSEQVQETPQTVKLEQVVKGLYSGTSTVSDVASMAVSEMNIIPVCYRTGILFCSSEVVDPTVNSSMDIYSVLNTLVLE